MILNVYSIYDSAAATYGRPFFLPSAGIAMRQFSDEVNRPAEDNIFYKHPNDFFLYFLGKFNDETGEFDLISRPEQIARAQDLVLSENSSEFAKRHAGLK